MLISDDGRVRCGAGRKRIGDATSHPTVAVFMLLSPFQILLSPLRVGHNFLRGDGASRPP